VINSNVSDQGATLSPNGRSLYFQSARTGGLGGNDLYVSRRACARCEWEPPQNLGPVVNSTANDGGPSLSDDGRLLFFSSARTGGQGSNDIYVSRRTDPRDDLGWGPPVPLGPEVNTLLREVDPEYVAGRGRRPATLYFGRGLPTGADFYSVPVTRDGEIAGPAVLSELSDPAANENSVTVPRDGRVVIFGSDRGTPGDLDLWMATRQSERHTWSDFEKLGPPLSTTSNEFQPSFSRDGRTLFFTSNRAGSLVNPNGAFSDDIWMTTRTRGNR
jgi:hypothetical protein